MHSICNDSICNAEELQELITAKLLRQQGTDPKSATKEEFYRATATVIRDLMSEMNTKTHDEGNAHKSKQVYYLSMEFLPGTSLRNNVFNLRLNDAFNEAVKNLGGDPEELFAMDPDAGLGNGGLGRLASCYLDAGASLGMGIHGMSICYEYGIFKQVIENGRQKELPDDWLNLGSVWLREKSKEVKEVRFGGKLKEIWNEKGELKLQHENYDTVLAIPMDMLVSGYDSTVVNKLRLWKSTSPISIDMELFAKGQYLKAMKQKHMAEVISKILYPEDAHEEGKTLRMMQQYFFISASMQTIVEKHLNNFPDLDNFADLVAIHINDTHPTMAIPELLRIFMDEHGYPWDKAWEIVSASISYTNHTIMSEALEVWPEELFAKLLPRIHSIVWEINRRLLGKLRDSFQGNDKMQEEMAIIHNGKLRMANLCVATAHKINGVSALHSGIIRNNLFKGFSELYPERFTNVTNGIAYRRWLCQANPDLSALLDELIGTGYRKDARELEKFKAFREDDGVLNRLAEIKRINKEKMAKYIFDHNGITVNLDSIFDVQVKRIHEYKRQLLNLVHIIHLYLDILENPWKDHFPRTFIFAGKSAAGYHLAKEIIRLAYNLSVVINNDPRVGDLLKVIFLENYSVSQSEIIMPAAEVSEQISLAGKEASGTGNMKLMINGAITLGTMDGANVEIHEAVGDDNMFLFGMKVEEVEALRNSGTYSPWSYYRNDENVAGIVGFMSGRINGESFGELLNYLGTGFDGTADPYFIVADFNSYREAHKRLAGAYRNTRLWNRMSLTNIASAGIFSADRAVQEYCDNIWNVKALKVGNGI